MDTYRSQKQVARANREFYRAFEALDVEAMERVWLASAESRCVHPGGELIVGIDRVLASWRAIFSATREIRIDVTDVTIQVHGALAVVHAVERLESPAADGPFQSSAAATNLFVEREGDWRMCLHHASPIARRFFPEGLG